MFCTIRDCDIYYETIGEGIPVIMLHGFPLDHQMMKGALEPIFYLRNNWKRIYFDFPGMGQSQSSEKIKGCDDMVQYVLEFIDKITSGENFLIIGESFGGLMARAILYHRSEKIDGMFLFCPAMMLGKTKSELPVMNVTRIDEEFMKTLDEGNRRFMQAFALVQDTYTWQRIQKEVLPGFKLRNIEFISRFSASETVNFTYDIDVLAEPFKKPVLIITGKQDTITGYKDTWEIYDNYPRGTFVVLDKAGHGLQYEQVPLFNVLTDEWLDRVEEELEEEP